MPTHIKENGLHSFLSRMTNNSGGRIVKIDASNREALVSFKCKSDAQRCHHRIDNRPVNGFKLSSKLISNEECQTIPKIREIPSQNHESRNQTDLQANSSFVAAKTNASQQTNHQDDMFMQILNLNKCFHSSCHIKKSKNSDFLFRKSILNVHISLDQLSRQIYTLLQKHSGKILLNSLPNCWLNEFNEEFNTVTKPKVMLEHLLNSISGISITNQMEYVEGMPITIKYITLENSEKKANIRLTKKLRTLRKNIKSIILKQIPNDLTAFPSALLNNLQVEYKRKFNVDLDYKNFGVSSMLELINMLQSFNIYTYDEDYIITLKTKDHIARMADDFDRLYPMNFENIKLELCIGDLPEILQNNIFDIENYGFCANQDVVNILCTQKFENIKLVSNRTTTPISIDIFTIEEKEKMQNLIECLINILKLQPNFYINLQQFRHYFPTLMSDYNIESFSFKVFEQYLTSQHSSTFHITFVDGCSVLLLTPRLRIEELGNRLIKVFNRLNLISHNSCSTIYPSIDINQLFFHYLLQYHIKIFDDVLFGEQRLSALLEKVLAICTKDTATYCLVYTNINIYFQNIDLAWKQKQIFQTFFILSQESSYSSSFKNLRKIFFKKCQFSYSLNLILDEYFQQYFLYYKTHKTYSLKWKPICEFAWMCYTVFILHPKSTVNTLNEQAYTLSELTIEFKHHYGLSLHKPVGYENQDFKSIFQKLSWLFDVETDNNTDQLIIRFAKHVTHSIDITSSSKCSYCFTKYNVNRQNLIFNSTNILT